MPEIDPYAVLGVPRSATREEIARAYRTLAKRLHPDAGPDTASVAMSRVNEAWRILSDPVRRRGWDARHAMATAPHWRTAPATGAASAADVPRRPTRTALPRTRRDSGWLAVAVLAVCALLVATVMVFVNAAVGPEPADDGEAFTSSEVTFLHPPNWTVIPGVPDQPAGHRVIAHLSSYGIEPGDACTNITLPCALTAADVPPGEATIIITSWSDGVPPADPTAELPAGLDTDATIGGEPAAFRWQSSDDGAVAWWQLSPPGFPDRWIEVHANLGGRELEQRDALEKVNEVLRTLHFPTPTGS